MRVAIFTNNYFPRLSGVSVAVQFLQTALSRLGHQVLVVAPDYGFGEDAGDVRVIRVRSLYLTPMKVSMPLKFLDEDVIYEHVEDFAPEIVHVHHPFWLGKAGLEIADDLKVPLVYTFHTLYDFFAHYFLLDTEAVRQAVREYVIRFANRCDLVIAPTEPIRQYLKEIGITARTEAVPTGLDLSRFADIKPEEVERLRRQHGLQRFEAILLYVGRVSREKNLGLALGALKVLVGERKNAVLAIIGGGTARRYFERMAEKLGIADRVVWFGLLDQVQLAHAYRLGHVFLFPSFSDTQGIVLYEARAAGLPLVALESMASRAILRPGENGLFAENDPQDFAQKITQILQDLSRFQAPFDTAAYSHETLGQRYQQLYSELWATGRKATEKTGLKNLLEEFKDLF
jgi:glycosyltransferase involved in cell wall biosynthesis